jgi:hypothetical protein
MHVLKSRRPELWKLTAHESSPAERRITEQFKLMFFEYTPSQYFEGDAKEYGFNIYPGQIDENLISELRSGALFPTSCKPN